MSRKKQNYLNLKWSLKFVSFTFFTCIFANAKVMAQQCKEEYFGTKTVYASQQVKYASPPIGYEPVFINHVGRHGARHLTKEVNATFACSLLMKAESAKALTVQGAKLKNMVVALDKVEKGNINSISVTGKQEQHDIAGRMCNNYPSIFMRPYCLSVAVTNKIRTQQSAEAFVSGLQNFDPKNCVLQYHKDDEHLRFYDLSPAYLQFQESGNWQTAIAAVEQSTHAEAFRKQFISRFFTASFISTLQKDDDSKFLDDVYGFASIVHSVMGEVSVAGFSASDVDIRSLFSCKQLQLLDQVSSAEDYLLKGPGTDIEGIQVKIAVPLLVDFIKSADECINGKKQAANLRFTHAEAIAPLAALLGMQGASAKAADIRNYSSVWKAEKVIPLSANIQWIFYKSAGKNDYLVKFLLNEKEVKITGLSAAAFPFYNWKDVRAFYLKKLQKMHASLDGDMNQYLMQVK